MRMKRFLAGFLCVCMIGSMDAPYVHATSAPAETKEEQQENGNDVAETTEKADATENAETTESVENTEEQKALLNYAVIDKPMIETPDTQKILLSIGDETTVIESAVLNYINETTGTTYQVQAEKISQDAVLFSMEFPEGSETGSYRVTSVSYQVAGVQQELVFKDAGMDMIFGVNTAVTTNPDSVVVEDAPVDVDVVTMDANGTAQAEDSIQDAIQNAQEETILQNGTDAAAIRGAKRNIVVVLDPGHDDTHAGARANGLAEEQLTFKIAQYCKEELSKYSGVTVYMTRQGGACANGGSAVSSVECNAKRVEYAQSVGANVYVSMHINAGGGNGAEIFYPNQNYRSDLGTVGHDLAQKILNKILELGIREHDRGLKIHNSEDNTLYPDGSLADYLGVIRRSKLAGIPAILIEHAYIDTSDAATYLNSDEKLKRFGIADATGIANYYGLSKKTETPVITSIRPKGESVLQISWRASASQGYEVYRSTRLEGGYKKIATVSAGTSTYKDNYRVVGKTYYYKVRSIKGKNQYSKYSEVKTGVPLGRVNALYVKSRTSGGVTVKWEKALGATQYAVTRKQSGSSSYQQIAVTGDKDYFVDGSAQAGVKYSYKVRPMNGQGYGSYGKSVSGISLQKPTISYVKAVDSGKLKVAWKSVPGAGYYQVYRSTRKNGTYKKVKETTSLSYTNGSRTEGKTYYYKVRAVRKVADGVYSYSNYSAKKSARVLKVPVIRSVASYSGEQLQIDWDTVKSANYYQLYRSTSKDGTYDYVATVKENSYIDGALTQGTEYYYKVRAVNKTGKIKGYSSYSEEVSGKTIAATIINEVYSHNSSQIKLRIKPVKNASGYQIFRSTAKKGTYKKVAEVSSATYLDTKLSAGTTYYYKVRVVQKKKGVKGYSSYSGVRSCRALQKAGIIAIRSLSSTKLEIQWNKTAGANYYELYRSTNKNSGYKKIKGTSKTSCKDTNRTEGKTYYYKIRAYKLAGTVNGKSSMSGIKSAKTIKRVQGVNAAISGEEAVVTWTGVSGVQQYQIKKSTSKNSGYKVVATVSGQQYRDKTVASVGSTYYYQVRAVRNSGGSKEYGSYSESASVTTGYKIMGISSVNTAQMAAYYRSSGKTFPSDVYASKGAAGIDEFCQIVMEETTAEGVRAEVLFAQICLETGFLQFGGDVHADQCNFGGLGATGGGVAGNVFPDVRTGIRAQVQHLKAYASTEPLNQACVDNRFKYVARGCAQYVQGLGIPDSPTGKGWAAAKGYGYNLVRMIRNMKRY